jgi:response regulator RpfG family c-di-GMP phosphodiesterase
MSCHRQRIDAVVLDLRMPEIDDRSVLQQLHHCTRPCQSSCLVDTAQKKLRKSC